MMSPKVKVAVAVGVALFVGHTVGVLRQPPPQHTVEVVTEVVEREVEVEVIKEVPQAFPKACDDLTGYLDDYAATIGEVTGATGRIKALTSEAQRSIGAGEGHSLVPLINEMYDNLDTMGDAVVAEESKRLLWESARDRCKLAVEVASH